MVDGREETPARRHRAARNLSFHDTDQNRIWLAISALAADLLAWRARLALPPNGAIYEPKRLWLRILAVVERLVRSARRLVLHIDPAWPWANAITTGRARLCTLPARWSPTPAHTNPDQERRPHAGRGPVPPDSSTTVTKDQG